MYHPKHVDDYNPPLKVARHLIKHAIRHIPNNKILLEKIHPKAFNPLHGLKPHKYNDSGKIQFVWQ